MSLFRNNRTIPVKSQGVRTNSLQTWDDLFSQLAELPNLQDWRKLENFSPAINYKETADAYIVEAELPGMTKDQIEISFNDNSLCLKGEKRTVNEEKKEDYHHIERTYGSFYRVIPMAPDADKERVSAKFENGLLIVDVAKTKGSNRGSKKIDIN